jgi:hypothetical protein
MVEGIDERMLEGLLKAKGFNKASEYGIKDGCKYAMKTLDW